MRSGIAVNCRCRQGGIALVLVLWVIALLTTIAAAMVVTGRTESALIRNRVEEVRLRAAADAAAAFALLRLQADEEDDQWVPDGTSHDWTFAGQQLSIRIVNESSLIDLNRGSEQLLTGLVEALGLAAEGDDLVRAILDWRDGDQVAGAGGAEDADYRAAALAYGSKDGRFDSVEELRQVLGVSAELYRQLEPNLTVRSRSSKPNADFAPSVVREAMGLESEQGAEEENGASSASGKHGPLYRIQVGLGEGNGPTVTLMINASKRRDKAYTLIWRRLGWRAAESGEAAASPGGG